MSTNNSSQPHRPSHSPDPRDVAKAKTCILRQLDETGDGTRLSDFEDGLDVDEKAVVVAVEELQGEGLVETEAVVRSTAPQEGL